VDKTYLIWTSVTIGLLAWATLLRINWPRLASQGFAASFSFLAAVHVFRPIGLIALLPQHLDPAPFGFTQSYLLQVAWGDAAAAVLAIIAIWAVLGQWRGAMAWAWAFVIVGTLDTLNAGPQFILAIHDQTLVGALGWLILTIYVPALLVTEAVLVWLLVRQRRKANAVPPAAAARVGAA
jgi:hypothetical protein